MTGNHPPQFSLSAGEPFAAGHVAICWTAGGRVVVAISHGYVLAGRSRAMVNHR